MKLFVAMSAVAFGWGCSVIANAQGGFGGGGGGRQGSEQQAYDGSVQSIERAVSTYLNGDEIKNILTPGEYSEWPLTLKDDQVVIAEARSDAFDPALEIVGSDGKKVLASSDDRYPGDQRPLLLWRCEKAGSYSLRARCFHDKSGGQFFLRFKVYECIELGHEITIERATNPDGTDIRPQILIRIPMKAGQIKQIAFEQAEDNPPYRSAEISQIISPIGLPDINLSRPLDPVMRSTLMAAVDGDYFAFASAYWPEAKLLPVAKDIAPAKFAMVGGASSVQGPTNRSSLWEVSVKAGDVLEASMTGLDPGSLMVVAEEPDIAKYDVNKPDKNPFFPRPADKANQKGSAIVALPARARDGRIIVFAAKKDATLWIGANCAGPKDKQFTLSVGPAPKVFSETGTLSANLRVGRTDYWAFDAKVGDVMTFDASAPGFTQQVVVRNPSFEIEDRNVAGADQSPISWNMIVQKPGRYLVAISSLGDGGGGGYSLSRKVVHARDFSTRSPAQGDFSDKQVHVWRFTAKPEEPLLIRWKSSNPSYRAEVRFDTGEYPTGINFVQTDNHTQFAILKVAEPRAFLIVLYPGEQNWNYSIELSDLPVSGKGG
ncbi:MAG: hypothetical protein ACHQ50_06395 [Fimbriimonadales bacterium]